VTGLRTELQQKIRTHFTLGYALESKNRTCKKRSCKVGRKSRKLSEYRARKGRKGQGFNWHNLCGRGCAQRSGQESFLGKGVGRALRGTDAAKRKRPESES